MLPERRSNSIPVSWLSDVVKACPDKLSCHEILLDGSVPSVAGQMAPVYSRLVVGCQLSVVERRFVNAPAVNRGAVSEP